MSEMFFKKKHNVFPGKTLFFDIKLYLLSKWKLLLVFNAFIDKETSSQKIGIPNKYYGK